MFVVAFSLSNVYFSLFGHLVNDFLCFELAR
jgi:hypothetical protein